MKNKSQGTGDKQWARRKLILPPRGRGVSSGKGQRDKQRSRRKQRQLKRRRSKRTPAESGGHPRRWWEPKVRTASLHDADTDSDRVLCGFAKLIARCTLLRLGGTFAPYMRPVRGFCGDCSCADVVGAAREVSGVCGSVRRGDTS